jgi:hypothetical protein
MTLDELREVLETGEELEYHLMGMEQNAHLLNGPGWYRCRVDHIHPNGNVEIELTDPEVEGYFVTVLKKNISVAFRRKLNSVQTK